MTQTFHYTHAHQYRSIRANTDITTRFLRFLAFSYTTRFLTVSCVFLHVILRFRTLRHVFLRILAFSYTLSYVFLRFLTLTHNAILIHTYAHMDTSNHMYMNVFVYICMHVCIDGSLCMHMYTHIFLHNTNTYNSRAYILFYALP